MLLVIAGLAVVSLLIGVMLGTNVKRMKRSDKADAAGSNAKSEQNATEIELSQSAVHKNDESAQQPAESSDETVAGTVSLSDGGSSDAGAGQNISGTDSAAGSDADVNLQTEPAPAEYVSKDNANYTYEQMMEDLEEIWKSVSLNCCVHGASTNGTPDWLWLPCVPFSQSVPSWIQLFGKVHNFVVHKIVNFSSFLYYTALYQDHTPV